MINYSIVMRGNPTDKTVAKKAYASAQYSEVMDINRFAEHIASHGCVYKRSDIVAILTMSVDCMREQLLEGKKIRLGERPGEFLHQHQQYRRGFCQGVQSCHPYP